VAGYADAATQQAKVPDTIAQRVVACTTCHGKEGRATNEGYFPRIAGKPAGYLYNQLVNFRDGRRDYPLMTYLVEHLTDSYLARSGSTLQDSTCRTRRRNLRAFRNRR
jgi:cytochrome c553